MQSVKGSHQPARRSILAALPGLGIAAAAAVPGDARAAIRHLDLDSPWDNLEAYLKARTDISGEQSVSWRSGLVWSFIPGRKSQVLMLAQNLKCTRCIKDATGYEFLERECLIFSDPETAQPLTTWYNPFTERTVEVFHIQNDSAGRHLDADGSRGPFHMDYMEHSGDVTFYDDLFYATPSALNVEEYSPYATSNTYEGAGIYNYHTRRADLDNADLSSVPVIISHTGIRQWLPFMEMGGWSGGIVLPARGKKIASVAEVPQPFLGWLEKNSPEFLQAPTMSDKDSQIFYYQHFREYIDLKRAGER